MPPSVILNAVLYGILLPALVTALGLLAALLLRRGAAVAVAVGIGAGLVALAKTDQIGWGFLEPERSWDWLPGLLLLALLVGLLEQTFSLPLVLRWLLRLIVAALTGWLLYRAEAALQTDDQPVELWWSGAVAGAVVLLWGVLDHSARTHPTALLPASLTVVLFALAGMMELSGNMGLAQAAGVFGASLLATSAVALWRSPFPLIGSAIPVVAIVVPGLLFADRFNNYVSIPLTAFLLLLLAPLPLAVIGLSRSRRVKLASVAVMLVMVAVALVLAARAEPT